MAVLQKCMWRKVSLLMLLFITSGQTKSISRTTEFLTFEETPYFEIPLDPDDDFHFFWEVDYDNEELTIELRAKLSNYQWFAIGFSDYGDVKNADVCVYWIDRSGNARFQDGWTDGDGFISTDEEDDCELIERRHVSGRLHLLFRRKFDTCDQKDYVIEDGTTHVIYGTGLGPLRYADGIRLEKERHGFQRVQMLKNLNTPSDFPPETESIVLLNDKVHVPGVETTYWCSLHRLPDLDTKHHLIQFGAQIQKGNEPLVHHMELFHCELDKDAVLPDWNGPCTHQNKPPVLEACKRVVAAWATGAEPLAYPEEAGEPIGGENYNPFVMLEVHYNNPELKTDWIDSSGIRFYYTSKLRKYDAGTMELGLEYTPKMGIPPKQQEFKVSGYCVPECTRVGLNPNGITIFASQLHTHLTGVQVYTKHIRGGKEMKELNRDDHYSSHFQEIRTLKEPIVVMPGDALVTTCTYDTMDRINITLGGFSITDEMCVNYVHYYPKGLLEVCKSSVDTQDLNDYFDVMESYELQPTSPKKDVIENYHSIQWSQMNADKLKNLYETSSLSMQCNKSSGDRFPGFWEGVPLTVITQELKPPSRNCQYGNIRP